MNPVPVPENAKRAYPRASLHDWGKPQGYSDDEIGSLPAQNDFSEQRFPQIRSYWKPDAHELELLLAGGVVQLNVVSSRMVPVSIAVFPADVPGAPEAVTSSARGGNR